MYPTLFHFSDDNAIKRFVPRPLAVPSPRRAGMEWLNSPLVWAIDAWHQPMYLFPRECPRILLWCKDMTTKRDRDLYFGASDAQILAYVESAWLPKIESQTLYRYQLPTDTFQSLEDAGMWVSKAAVTPTKMEPMSELTIRLRTHRVELRVVNTLTSLKHVWNTSLHASGIRLRNAADWYV